MMYSIIIRFFVTIVLSFFITPIMRVLSFRINAVDYPNQRRINTEPMPSAGGLSIFVVFAFSSIVLFNDLIPKSYLYPILFGGLIVVITGLLDDIYELSPKMKMVGIFFAACLVYFLGDFHFNEITLPFIGYVNVAFLSFPLTIIWILGITNAINLIDGLDGLAAGISIIALSTLGIIGFFFLVNVNYYVAILVFTLVSAIIGFLPYNYYPASIYLGDTGALFLGFMIAVVSLQNLKSVTFVGVITPILIIGVPIMDVMFAIIRRIINKRPITSADKMHLHHRLLYLGFTHKGAVLIIYSIALLFSFVALLMNYQSLEVNMIIIIILMASVEFFIEFIELIGPSTKPILSILNKIKMIFKKK